MAERTDLVEFGGAGPPILLLHGLMGCARTWRQVAQWLLPYGRVLGLDARAHGRSARAGPCTTDDFADDVDELLREVDARPAVVVGHSMGGLHALVAAARSPQLVRAVVVEDMAVDQRGRTVDAWRATFESWPVPFESLAHVRQFFTPYGDYFTECMAQRADGYHLMADLSELYAIAAEWGEREYWAYVDKIHCPVLVVEAEHTLMPEGQQAELARRVPGGGTHVRVPGTGHLVHEDAPETYRAAVEPFVRSALRSSAGPAA